MHTNNTMNFTNGSLYFEKKFHFVLKETTETTGYGFQEIDIFTNPICKELMDTFNKYFGNKRDLYLKKFSSLFDISNHTKKIFVLYGPGKNGKTVFRSLLNGTFQNNNKYKDLADIVNIDEVNLSSHNAFVLETNNIPEGIDTLKDKFEIEYIEFQSKFTFTKIYDEMMVTNKDYHNAFLNILLYYYQYM